MPKQPYVIDRRTTPHFDNTATNNIILLMCFITWLSIVIVGWWMVLT